VTEPEIDRMLEHDVLLARDEYEVELAVDSYLERMAHLRDEWRQKERSC
jgi:hypothetical protein